MLWIFRSWPFPVLMMRRSRWLSDVQGMLCLIKNAMYIKPLSWLRPRRESSLGTASTDRLANSLLSVPFWIWQGSVSSGVSASVSVDLSCSTNAMQTNLNFIFSVACHVLSKALLPVDPWLSEILWFTAQSMAFSFWTLRAFSGCLHRWTDCHSIFIFWGGWRGEVHREWDCRQPIPKQGWMRIIEIHW